MRENFHAKGFFADSSTLNSLDFGAFRVWHGICRGNLRRNGTSQIHYESELLDYSWNPVAVHELGGSNESQPGFGSRHWNILFNVGGK